MTYPREIILENEELKALIEEKSKLVLEGRTKSEEIEKLEIELAKIDTQLQEEEKKVDLGEFKKKEKSISKRMDKCIADIEAIKKAIYAKIKKETPQELRDNYEKLNKEKEEKETERNKIALDAQKRNDLIIPITRELVKPLLQDEYEDYETVFLKDGQVICNVFSHLEDWKANFNTRKKV